MNTSYHQALMAAGIDVTYQVHSGTHSPPDFLNEIKAMLKWGLFKPVVTEPVSWHNQTVATKGQLWDFNYRFANPPTRIVKFRQSGERSRSVPRIGRHDHLGQRVRHSHIYAGDRSPAKPQCHSPSGPDKVGRRACP